MIKTCICITAMARHRCQYANELTGGCDLLPIEPYAQDISCKNFSQIKHTFMLVVNNETVNTVDPDQLTDSITKGTAKIDIVDIDTAITLVARLIEALSGRKQIRRRVEVLENIVQAQQRVLDMLTVKS